MKQVLLVALAALVVVGFTKAEDKEKKVSTIHDFKMTGIDGKEVNLADMKGKVVLLVNVASKCGYTKQYTGLQSLYETYADKDFVVIGVPANDFGAQEPGTNEEIQTFCSSKFNVKFPMMAKVSVKGKEITPLYQYLTSKETNPKYSGEIGWNFEKFLIDREGNVIGRYKSSVAPESEELKKAIVAALETK